MFDFFMFRSFFKDYDIDDRFKQYKYFIITICFSGEANYLYVRSQYYL